jgi:hypothetical protein
LWMDTAINLFAFTRWPTEVISVFRLTEW